MSAVIFSILFAVILLCSLWFHDTWYPPEGRAERKHWSPSLDRVESGNKHSNQRGALPQPSPVVSLKKAAFMTISQPTTSPFETTREAATNEQIQGVGAVRGNAEGAIEDLPTGRNGSNDHPPETIPPSEPTRRPIIYPEWPTSRPGPQITAPLPGQHPHPLRTDQMVYACYDQERGMPCVAPPRPNIIQQHRGKQYLPDTSTLETADEAQAIERWLNDGGIDVSLVRTTGGFES